MAFNLSSSTRVAERPRLANSYFHSPLRSKYFVLPSLLGLIDLLFIGVLLAHDWTRLNARVITALALAAVCVLMGWSMSFRSRRIVRRYLKTKQIEVLEPGSPLETGLYVAAFLTYYGFLWTLGALGFALGAFSEFFIR
jgi:hypothetical protein